MPFDNWTLIRKSSIRTKGPLFLVFLVSREDSKCWGKRAKNKQERAVRSYKTYSCSIHGYAVAHSTHEHVIAWWGFGTPFSLEIDHSIFLTKRGSLSFLSVFVSACASLSLALWMPGWCCVLTTLRLTVEVRVYAVSKEAQLASRYILGNRTDKGYEGMTRRSIQSLDAKCMHAHGLQGENQLM